MCQRGQVYLTKLGRPMDPETLLCVDPRVGLIVNETLVQKITIEVANQEKEIHKYGRQHSGGQGGRDIRRRQNEDREVGQQESHRSDRKNAGMSDRKSRKSRKQEVNSI